MADVAFNCPQCGQNYRFAADLAGKRARCKKCQTVFEVPASAAPSTIVTATAARGGASTSSATMASSRPSRPSDDGKVPFNCPHCGRGFRLDAKLAGRQGRCTSCQGVFTIPSAPGASAPARPALRPASPDRSARPPAGATAVEDAEWWELDSGDEIPTGTAMTVVNAEPVPAEWAPDFDDPVITAQAVRPQWVTYAAVGAGVVVGGIVFALTFMLLSGGGGKLAPPAVAAQNEETPEPTAPAPAPTPAPAPAPLADARKPSPPPSPTSDGLARRHRQAVDMLIRGYNQIADGYARIQDAGSIPGGYAMVNAGAFQLREASRRGKELDRLPDGERRTMVQETGPRLLQAIERVLSELRRLQATPGLKSEFERLIDGYTRTRDTVRRELDRL